MITEMTDDQPSCEEGFAATDALACHNHVLKFQESPPLSTCIQMLLVDDFELNHYNHLASLTTLNLFTIINGKNLS